MKHKVTMLSMQMGVDDGELHPKAFMQGEEYEIGDALMESFIEMGVVDISEKKSAIETREKKIVAPEKNKEEGEDKTQKLKLEKK